MMNKIDCSSIRVRNCISTCKKLMNINYHLAKTEQELREALYIPLMEKSGSSITFILIISHWAYNETNLTYEINLLINKSTSKGEVQYFIIF